jgi:hypothetical protein
MNEYGQMKYLTRFSVNEDCTVRKYTNMNFLNHRRCRMFSAALHSMVKVVTVVLLGKQKFTLKAQKLICNSVFFLICSLMHLQQANKSTVVITKQAIKYDSSDLLRTIWIFMRKTYMTLTMNNTIIC